jgi:hypothetical protein
MNNHVLNENETDVVNSYIGKKSLCMLLLASSILFYTMAKTKNQRKIIPRLYTLIISLLLIIYAIFLGSFALAEFNFHINNLINKSFKLCLKSGRSLILIPKYSSCMKCRDLKMNRDVWYIIKVF